MSDQLGRRFDPAELGAADGPSLSDAEAADALAMARDLETFARAETPMPSSGFEDRIMAAIASEPAPRGAIAGPGRRSIAAIVADAWHVAWAGGRPLVIRAQAFALLAVTVVALGALGTAASVGLFNLLAPDASPSPTPTQLTSPAPTTAPEPAPTPDLPSPSPSVAPSVEPSPSPSGGPSDEPSETPGSTGSSGGSSPDATSSPRPTATNDEHRTPRPTETPRPTDTPEPTGTPQPTETPDGSSGSGTGSGTGSPSDQPD